MKRKDTAAKLQRKSFAFKAEAKDDGTFTGYASVFGVLDSYREIVAPGAFANSLAEIKAAGDPLPMLWQHNSDSPIGGYDAETLVEDDTGLRVSGWLMIKDIPLAAQAHALLMRRVIRGLSIGYYVRADSYDEKTNIRTLTELELAEISPVTFPANTEATIDAVKAHLAVGELPNLREFEKFLREAGFSKSQATAVANGGLSKLLRGEPAAKTGETNLGERLLSILTTGAQK